MAEEAWRQLPKLHGYDYDAFTQGLVVYTEDVENMVCDSPHGLKLTEARRIIKSRSHLLVSGLWMGALVGCVWRHMNCTVELWNSGGTVQLIQKIRPIDRPCAV